ncbi:MAG TPA: S8 family serine peptidase [Candidatus Elarobacter sp.]|jgi:subtilisin family serine protease
MPATVDASNTLPGASATLNETLSLTPPSGVPTLSISGSTPIAYVTVSASATVYFPKTPTVAVRPSASVPTYGYLAAYSASGGWVAVAGATTLVNSLYTIASTNALFSIAPASPMTFAVFGTNSLVPTLTPPGNTDTCSSAAEWVTGVGRRPRLGVTRPASAYVVSNRLYVTRTADTRSANSLRALSTRTVALGTSNGLVHEAITLPPGVDAKTATAQLRATAGVVDVQPVHRRFLSGDAEANDSWLDNDHQWYLYKTNVDTGLAGGGAWGITHGTGIKVAVIDTGIDETNSDFQGKVDKTMSIVGGLVTNSAQDTNGHGTNVNGLVAAQPNNGFGFAGTGWDVHLLSYKIFPDATTSSDCQGADAADEAAAINDAVSSGASVISLSLGSPNSVGSDSAEQAAVQGAISAGVTVVAADGNEGPGSAPDYPAAYTGVIAVGASSVSNSTQDVYSSITAENVATYSNDSPTLVAPGGDALSDGNTIDYLHWITGYGTTTATLSADRCTMAQGFCVVLFNGTSQATPQVSGAVALMMAKHGGPRSLTPSQVKTILTSTAHSLPGIGATRQGAGRLDVQAAVNGS